MIEIDKIVSEILEADSLLASIEDTLKGEEGDKLTIARKHLDSSIALITDLLVIDSIKQWEDDFEKYLMWGIERPQLNPNFLESIDSIEENLNKK